ncbi:hypothetical protein ACHAPA_010262, partial [Fusarium lateritium]
DNAFKSIIAFKAIIAASVIIDNTNVLYRDPLIIRSAADTSHPSVHAIARLLKHLRDVHKRIKRAKVRRRFYHGKVKQFQAKMAMDGKETFRATRHTVSG